MHAQGFRRFLVLNAHGGNVPAAGSSANGRSRIPAPAEPKPMLVEEDYRVADPVRVRELIGDGSYGGPYRRSDEEMLQIWQAGVEEVRDLLENAWR